MALGLMKIWDLFECHKLYYCQNPGDHFNLAILGNIGSCQPDEIWKTTSIFLKMEDDPNFFQMEDDLNFVLGNLGSWFSVFNIVLVLLSNQDEDNI